MAADAPSVRTQPLWVRAAQSPPALRIVVLVALSAAYVTLFLLAVDGPGRFALRPVNLVLVVVAGALFGTWGGIGWSVLLTFVNVALYVRAGIWAANTEQLTGNILSIFAGVLAGAVVGRISELSLRLREEVERRRLAESRKQELTALLVHDLNNPLAAIIGYADLLRIEGGGPERLVQESAEAISQAAQRMRRMLLNMLDIGRAEDGQLKLNRQQVDLGKLLEELKSGFSRQLAERRLTLEVDGSRASVHADPELLRRMLVNLVDNAMKYSPREKTIRLELDGDARHVEVRVRDQGPGIPSGHEARIFEKYARLERDHDTAANVSRGLGLTFCRLAARAHGGDIWVEPSQPTGSVFTLRLPRGDAARQAAG